MLRPYTTDPCAGRESRRKTSPQVYKAPPPGIEPRLIVPKTIVLPLHQGGKIRYCLGDETRIGLDVPNESIALFTKKLTNAFSASLPTRTAGMVMVHTRRWYLFATSTQTFLLLKHSLILFLSQAVSVLPLTYTLARTYSVLVVLMPSLIMT